MLTSKIEVEPPSEADPETHDGRNQTMAETERSRVFGPVLCTRSVPLPFLAGTVRGRILGFSSVKGSVT